MKVSIGRAALATFLLALVNLTLGIVEGRAQPVVREERAKLEKELIDSQALERLIEYWRLSMREPGQALQAMRGQSRTVDPEAAWRKAVDHVLADRTLPSRIAGRQLDGITPDEARQVIAFRRTPLGRKVTEAEVTSPWPAEKLGDQRFIMSELAKAARALEKDKVRSKLLDDLLNAAGGGAVQTELMMAMARGFAIGATLAAPAGQARMSADDIAASIEAERPKFAALSGTIAVPSLAVAYRALSRAELEAYLKHLKSPVGRRNIAAATKSIVVLLSQISGEIGRLFAKDISAQRS